MRNLGRGKEDVMPESEEERIARETKEADEAKAAEEAEAAKAAEEADNTVSRDEFKKVIGQRDTLKKEIRKLKDSVKNTEGNADKIKDLESRLDEYSTMKTEYDEIVQAQEERELSKKTEAEKEAIRARKELDSFKEEMDSKINDALKSLEKETEKSRELAKTVDSLREVKLDQEIMNAAIKHNAVNPEQIVRMLKSSFTFDTDYSNYFHNVYNERGTLKDQVDVDAFVKDFLSDDLNDNLVKSSVKGGSGTSVSNTARAGASAGSAAPGSKGTGKSDFPKDVLAEKIETFAKMSEIDVDLAYSLHRRHGDKIFKM
jgi:myosin heavy subunit